MTSESKSAGQVFIEGFKHWVGTGALVLTAAVLLMAEVLDIAFPWALEKRPSLSPIVIVLAHLAVPLLLGIILTYVVLERFTVLKDLPTDTTLSKELETKIAGLLSQLREPNRVTICATQEETYSEIVKTISRLNATVSGQKDMWHAILHGSATPEGVPQPPKPAHLEEFDRALDICVRSTGKDRWFVHQFYNITTLQRLEVVGERLTRGIEGFEVRAVCLPGLLPVFSPLIVGEEDAFLAIIDSAGYRVEASIHLHGKKAVGFVTTYFRDLWDKSEFDLRTSAGVQTKEVEKLHRCIRSLTN
jgi:hypothetical protein